MGLSCLSVKVKMSNIIESKQLWQFQTGDPFSYRLGAVQLRIPELGKMQSTDILLPGMRARGQQDIRMYYGASCWPVLERGSAL